MASDPTRMNRINSFSLVSYIPDPIAAFLDGFRRELVPGCSMRAHVTVLPPRPLTAAADSAWRQVRELATVFPEFDVELTDVGVFPVSHVIYLAPGAGADRLHEMHAVFNAGLLAAHEVFEYSPHVTLAQDLPSEDLARLVEIARRRWAEYPHPRSFRVDRLTFVQNAGGDNWTDLGECQLGAGDVRLLEPVAAR